jgi:hypothetical protein
VPSVDGVFGADAETALANDRRVSGGRLNATLWHQHGPFIFAVMQCCSPLIIATRHRYCASCVGLTAATEPNVSKYAGFSRQTFPLWQNNH